MRRKRILILNVHPDDEVLAFGGLINKEIAKGNEVYIHTFCVGGMCSSVKDEVRKQELESVMNYFKVTAYSYDLGLDGVLDQVPTCKLTGFIDELINKYLPDEVYVSPDSEHGDHHALYKAFLASARLKSGWMPKLFAMGSYPFLDQLYPTPEGGKIFQPLTEEEFRIKCEAFKLHKSQFKPSPSPLGLEGLETQAKYYGMMCGAKYAELYYQLRYIRS